MKINLVDTILSFAFFTVSLSVSAQKLPQIQENGIWTTADLKAGTTFQAYNKATNIFYTLSNDDKNLYLTVKATDPVIINKITNCGITFSVEKPANVTALTFPAYDKENKAIYDIMINAPKAKSGEVDTFIQKRNAMRSARQKIIRIARGEKQSDISVYNDEGIKVAAKIDANLAYTQELAIPLNWLDIANADVVKYNICINGQIPKNATTIQVPGRPEILAFKGADGVDYQIGHTTPDNLILAYPTDLAGRYTLAKK